MRPSDEQRALANRAKSLALLLAHPSRVTFSFLFFLQFHIDARKPVPVRSTQVRNRNEMVPFDFRILVLHFSPKFQSRPRADVRFACASRQCECRQSRWSRVRTPTLSTMPLVGVSRPTSVGCRKDACAKRQVARLP